MLLGSFPFTGKPGGQSRLPDPRTQPAPELSDIRVPPYTRSNVLYTARIALLTFRSVPQIPRQLVDCANGQSYPPQTDHVTVSTPTMPASR